MCTILIESYISSNFIVMSVYTILQATTLPSIADGDRFLEYANV